MVTRWGFTSGGSTLWSFEVNPNAGGSSQLQKTFTEMPLSHPSALPVVFEGRPKAPRTTIEGTVHTQDEYETLTEWVTTKARVEITDDIGRTYSIIPIGLSWRPVPKRRRAWRHTYTLECIILTSSI